MVRNPDIKWEFGDLKDVSVHNCDQSLVKRPSIDVIKYAEDDLTIRCVDIDANYFCSAHFKKNSTSCDVKINNVSLENDFLTPKFKILDNCFSQLDKDLRFIGSRKYGLF